jgi:hypothetical protein
MKVEKEKYIAVLRQIYGSFCPVGMLLKVKILLALLALVVSFVVMFLKNLLKFRKFCPIRPERFLNHMRKFS